MAENVFYHVFLDEEETHYVHALHLAARPAARLYNIQIRMAQC
ncbi:hypothetical protein [Mycobacterium leprae]|nr:hypothetical protein [Mycobacterium leprae]